jgi:hypothetical protein
MMEPLTDLPDGVIGFEIGGKLHAADYKDVLLPAIEGAATDAGIRVVLVFTDWDGMSGGALWQDLKLGVEHLRLWKKIALVTDIEWMSHMVSAFGWMTPGDFKLFPEAEREAAIAWVAAEG